MATFTCGNSSCIKKETNHVEYETKGIKIDGLVDKVNDEIKTLQDTINERKSLIPMNGPNDKLSIYAAAALEGLSRGITTLSKGYKEAGYDEDLYIASLKHEHVYPENESVEL